MTDTKRAAKGFQMVQKHLHVVGPHSKLCFLGQDLASVTVNPTASMKSSKLLNLHTSLQPNVTEGAKGPPWGGQEHANRTQTHAGRQRLVQGAKAASPSLWPPSEGQGNRWSCSPDRQASAVFSS